MRRNIDGFLNNAVLAAVFASLAGGCSPNSDVVSPADAAPEGGAAAGKYPGKVTVVWKADGDHRTLAEWTPAKLKKRKDTRIQREKDPISGETTAWKGVRVQNLIEEALDQLSVSQKAKVDLIVLKGRIGIEAYVPRSFARKYDFLLAFDSSRGGLDRRGPLYSVVPWTSQPKTMDEWLPVRKFFVPGIHTIELASLTERFSFAYLRNRRNPIALRGEKIFMRNCLGCHANGDLPSNSSIAAESWSMGLVAAHRSLIKGLPIFSSLDRQALDSYFKEARLDHPTLFQTAVRPK